MKITLLVALILCPVFARADSVTVVSPSTAQTYSYSDATWHTLHWNPAAKQLSAYITFSTYNYVTHDQPLHEEDYQFAFPGVKFDRSTGTFFARTRHGKTVAVARLENGLIGKSIEPLPNTVIHIFKQSGRVTVVLTGSDAPAGYYSRLHWEEDNGGFFLNNAINAGLSAMR